MVYMETDVNTGSFESAGYQTWNVILKITSTSDDPNAVDVEMDFWSETSNILPGSLWIPEVSPKYLSGAINGTQLQLRQGSTVVGVFSFTTSNMMGTWDCTFTGAYGLRAYTETNAIKLYKQ